MTHFQMTMLIQPCADARRSEICSNEPFGGQQSFVVGTNPKAS